MDSRSEARKEGSTDEKRGVSGKEEPVVWGAQRVEGILPRGRDRTKYVVDEAAFIESDPRGRSPFADVLRAMPAVSWDSAATATPLEDLKAARKELDWLGSLEYRRLQSEGVELMSAAVERAHAAGATVGECYRVGMLWEQSEEGQDHRARVRAARAAFMGLPAPERTVLKPKARYKPLPVPSRDVAGRVLVVTGVPWPLDLARFNRYPTDPLPPLRRMHREVYVYAGARVS